MPVNVGCPNCGRKLRIEDQLLGKKVRCPDCKTVFVGESSLTTDAGSVTTSKGSSPPARADDEKPSKSESVSVSDDFEVLPTKKPKRRDYEEEDDDEEIEDDGQPKPKRLNRSEARAGWRKMQLALSLTIWGLNTFLTVSASFFIGAILDFLILIALASSKHPNGEAAGLLFFFGLILYIQLALGALAGFISASVGHGFFWQVPNQPNSGLRPMAIATMSLWFGSLALYLASFCCLCGAGSVMARGGGGGVYGCGVLLIYAMMIAWFFVFWIFMRFICMEVRDMELARAPIYFMVVFPTYIILGPIVMIILTFAAGAGSIMSLMSGESPRGAGALFIVTIALWLAFFIVLWCLGLWASMILQQIRKAVTRQSGR